MFTDEEIPSWTKDRECPHQDVRFCQKCVNELIDKSNREGYASGFEAAREMAAQLTREHHRHFEDQKCQLADEIRALPSAGKSRG